MSPVPDRSRFETAYAGQAPWDIGRPQKAFLDAADQVAGSVLDAGCGTGDNALHFAGRGCRVTGVDFLDEPIQRARRKAGELGLTPADSSPHEGGDCRGTPTDARLQVLRPLPWALRRSSAAGLHHCLSSSSGV